MSFLVENFTFKILATILAILVTVITYIKWKLKHWDRVGLPSLEPTFFFGNSKDKIFGKLTFGEQLQEFYNNIKSKGLQHGGVYLGWQPWYIPVDPKLIKHIMQIDSQYFLDHGNYLNEEDDPLSGHLISLKGAKWKAMRTKLSPTFTPTKTKMMFQTMLDYTNGVKDIMDKAANENNPVDIGDISARYTTDVIGCVAFGMDCNSLKEPDSEFRKYSNRIFEHTTWERLRQLAAIMISHNFLRMIKFKITKHDVEKFFMKTMQETVDYREKNNIYRKDFMDLLIQLKNRSVVSDDDRILQKNGTTDEKALTMNELTAQALVFFIAGFETSSTAMTFALLELAMNPDIQDKLREEINSILANYNNQLTYDGITEMTYLDKVFHETLRKCPPVTLVDRVCTKDYLIPHTNIHLKKGARVGISILGLHRDPEYYPNPESFDPDRFSEEKKKTRPQFTWLPFGEGPRGCIGLRFGTVLTKLGIAAILKNYRISLNSKTQIPITQDKNNNMMCVAGGVWLNVEKLN